jgi:predicted amidohydrolase
MKHRIASIQMTSSDNVTENLATAKKFIAAATLEGARLIVLPEMFAIMGVDQLDKVKHGEKFGSGVIQDFLQQEAEHHRVWIVGGTIPLLVDNNPEKVYASSLVFDDRGACVARYDKVHLFDVNLPASQEVYLESKTTQAGDKVIVVPTPFGKLGLAVCYDVRFPELFRLMHAAGVEIIALPAAFTHTTGIAHWEILVRARAIENLSYIITACQTGEHVNRRRTFGHNMIVNPWGEKIAFLAEGTGVISAEINLKYIKQMRENFPVLSHKKF